MAIPVLAKRAGGIKEPDKKRDRSEGPYAVAFGFLLFIIFVPIAVGYARIGVLPSYLFYPGFAIALVGVAIASWGLLTLGRFHQGYVRVISGHQVVQKGPYHFVRHPMYSGELLVWIGLGLMVQSWVSLLIILVSSAIFYTRRIRIEERFLATELGDEYVHYMRRTKRIIPYLA